MAAAYDEQLLHLVDGKAAEGGFPAPVTAAPAQTTRRRSQFKKCLYVLGGLVAVLYVMGFGRETRSPDYQVSKPKKPLTPAEAEKLFLTIPNAKSALSASRLWATYPHIAGSKEDFKDAKSILELFQTEFSILSTPELPIFDAGSEKSQTATRGITNTTEPTAWIDTYYPVLNLPLDRSVDILGEDGKSIFSANLVEDGDPLDPEAHKYKDYIPTFHGLSSDGDITGQLVYANYGSHEDYEELVKKGVDLKGKIILVRYGDLFRGLKIKGAEELGAAGVLIYSDPRDDGYVTVENGYDAYPRGPARNPTSVQRGSVQYLSSYPGDPTTPGYPAYPNATRTEGTNIPKIPSLPISWENAKRLLEELGGETEGRKLTGKASERKLQFVNHVDTKVTPIWNTMAAIPGHIKDEIILIGCHRDAWVMGAADPTSGTVSLGEIIHGLGHLLRNGWKPLRTIVIASWDAEEYGLVGSTEFGEDFADWIQKHVVTYLNVDVSVAGSQWHSAASPSLSHLIRTNAFRVSHPTKENKTLWDAMGDKGPYTNGVPGNFAIMNEKQAYGKSKYEELPIVALGSGSDFTVFLQRLGVASMDQSFSPTESDPVYHYHSVYDSQHWMENFADIGFHRHVAVAKHLGLMALSLTDSIILPLNTTYYSLQLSSYLDEVESIVSQLHLARTPDLSGLRHAIKHLQHASNKLDEDKAKAEKKFVKALKKLLDYMRKQKSGCGHARYFKRFVRRVFGVSDSSELEGAARMNQRLDRLWERVLAAEAEHGPEADLEDVGKGEKKILRNFIRAAMHVRRTNQKLVAFERGFIDEDGIKDREWYRHLGVAPGKWKGYGATTLPALTEALEIDHNVSLAEKEARRLEKAIARITHTLKV